MIVKLIVFSSKLHYLIKERFESLATTVCGRPLKMKKVLKCLEESRPSPEQFGNLVAYGATTSLLLVDLDRVAFLHLEGRWGVVFVDRRSIEAEAYHLHRQSLEKAKILVKSLRLEWASTYSSVAISIHQFPQRSVSLDLELHHGVVLTQNFQVDMLAFTSLFILET